MADINQIIAGGAGSSSRASFAAFDGIPDAIYKARDERAKNDLRDAFKDGVPLTSDGQPDFGEMAKVFFQKGGPEQGIAAANLGLQQSKLRAGQDMDATVNPPPASAQPSLVSPPSVNRSGSTVVAPPLNKGGAAPQNAGQPQQGGGTLMQVLSAQGIPNDQLGAATASIARQIGLQDPNQPIDLQDPQVRNVLVPAIQRLKQGGIGQVQPPQGQPHPQGQAPQGQPPAPQVQPQAPQPAPQVAQAQPQPQAAAPAGQDPRFVGLVPAGRSPDVQVHLLQRAIDSGILPPEQVKSYQNSIDAIRKAAEPTTAEKDLMASQRNPKIDERAAQQKADEAHATGVAQSDIKEQDGIISAGQAARSRLATLNTISNIISTDKNMTLGFGAETALKVKKAFENLGFDVGDLSGPQAIQKLNGLLAAESAKAVSPRPAQFEFKTFLNNNPGLDLDKAGNQRVIGIFSQLAKRDVDLGKLARQNRDNWQDWDSVVEKYDAKKENQIHDPVTGRIITTNSIVAPSPAKATQSAAAPPTTISSKADYDKLPSGAKFTGPDGKPWQKP